MAASQGCSTKNLGDKVILPKIILMTPLDREAAVLNLSEASNYGRWQLGRQDGAIYVQIQISVWWCSMKNMFTTKIWQIKDKVKFK